MMGAKPGMKNMRAKVAHYQTPVSNLFLGGHWAEYGGGVPGAVRAAANTSMLICKDKSPGFFEILKNVADQKITPQEANVRWNAVVPHVCS